MLRLGNAYCKGKGEKLFMVDRDDESGHVDVHETDHVVTDWLDDDYDKFCTVDQAEEIDVDGFKIKCVPGGGMIGSGAVFVVL